MCLGWESGQLEAWATRQPRVYNQPWLECVVELALFHEHATSDCIPRVASWSSTLTRHIIHRHSQLRARKSKPNLVFREHILDGWLHPSLGLIYRNYSRALIPVPYGFVNTTGFLLGIISRLYSNSQCLCFLGILYLALWAWG